MEFTPTVIVLILVAVLVAVALFLNRSKLGFGRKPMDDETLNRLLSRYTTNASNVII